ncbi:MAG: flagellar biosynthesis protein FlhB [Phycisphaerae bacterium]|nr:flagellar biosynthesis protein FlhB [Phycisphaerae bacterium]
MPDSAQERTEAPTQRRRTEARKAGQVARSSDLTAAVVLLGSLLVLDWFGRRLFGNLLVAMRVCMEDDELALTDPQQILPLMARVFRLLLAVAGPFLAVVVVLALLAAFMQIGYLVSFQSIKPSLNRVSPLAGIKRLFNARSVVQLLMGILKMSCVAAVAYSALRDRLDVFATAANLPAIAIVGVSGEVFFTVSIRLAIALLVLGIIDYIYQRYRLEKDLKMTKEEVKDEYKRMEGDPKLKSRRRQVQLEMALHRIKSAVPKADVVITNPTELAIAIRYDPDTMNAPRVLAKGADYLARRIREIAIEHGIPIVERKPLARALYYTVEVGQEIPSQFYKAVAEILAYVYELTGKRYASQAAVGAALNEPGACIGSSR